MMSNTNYKQTLIVFATILAIGVVALGALLKSGIVGLKDYDRIILVKGSAEIEVEADNVIWPISFKVAGNNLLSLYSEMEDTEQKIKQFLREQNIADSTISVAIPVVLDASTDQYNSSNKVAFRYVITSSITVNTREVGNTLKAMQSVSELIKQGIAINSSQWGRSSVIFDFNGLNDIKPKLIQQATANARISAEKFAIDSDSKLGKIKTARQGEVVISTPDITTPYKKSVRVVTTIEYFLKD